MKPFEWMNAVSINEAVQLLGSAPATHDPDEAPRLIAGGKDLLTSMKDYLVRPSRLVNIKRVAGLNQIKSDGKGGLTIGALVTISQLEQHAVVRKLFPGLSEAAHSIATPQIRNLGTCLPHHSQPIQLT